MKTRSSRNLVVAGVLLFALFVGACFWLSAWLRADEAALDYSALDVETAPADPEVNGYSLIREFSLAHEDSDNEDLDEVYLLSRADWDLAVMEGIVEQRQELVEAFAAGFRKELFAFDQPVSPETLVPEVGEIRRYVQVKILRARIAQLENKPDRALQTLMGLESDLETFTEAGGGLINLLVAVACTQMLNQEIEGLLAHADPGLVALEAARRDYDIGAQFPLTAQTTFRYEFQFVLNCIEMVVDDPENMMGGASKGDGLIAKWNQHKSRASIRYLFKPNRTKNDFFRAYREIIRELPHPVQEREFPVYEAMEADSERGTLSVLSRNLVGQLLVNLLLPALEKVIEQVDLAQARCGATRLALALKAYQVEHGGLPESLEALVPDYLASVPSDPFDGEPLRYDQERAILYSVGNDFVDAGGSERPFAFELEEHDGREEAESDASEPTFALRFAR